MEDVVVFNGNAASCGLCGEVVYDNISVFSNHGFTLTTDGRRQWFAHDLGGVTHLCAERFSVVAEAERFLSA